MRWVQWPKAEGRPERLLAVASLVFALRFVALAAYTPYTFLWLESNGFTTHERGLLGGFGAAVRLCAPVCLGALADWTGRRRNVFIAATLLNGFAVAALTLRPHSAAWQACFLGMGSLTETGALLDAFVMRSLSWAGRAEAAPRARAWGALTWCATAPLFGAISQSWGIATLFSAYGGLQLCGLPFCLMLPISEAYGEEQSGMRAAPITPVKSDREAEVLEPSGAKAGPNDKSSVEDVGARSSSATPAVVQSSFDRRVRGAVGGSGKGSRELRFAMPLLVLVGLQMGIGFAFGFIYLEEELHAPGFLIGLSLTAQAAIEVPLFRAAGRIVSMLGGLRPALLSTSLAGCLRFVGWSLAANAWMVLPFECGHGWSFALAYTNISTIGDLMASDGLQATVVGLLSSCLGAGNLAATLGWGLVVETIGLRASFRAAAAIFGFAFVISLAFSWLGRRGSTLAAMGRESLSRGSRVDRNFPSSLPGSLPPSVEAAQLMSHISSTRHSASEASVWVDSNSSQGKPATMGNGSNSLDMSYREEEIMET